MEVFGIEAKYNTRKRSEGYLIVMLIVIRRLHFGMINQHFNNFECWLVVRFIYRLYRLHCAEHWHSWNNSACDLYCTSRPRCQPDGKNMYLFIFGTHARKCTRARTSMHSSRLCGQCVITAQVNFERTQKNSDSDSVQTEPNGTVMVHLVPFVRCKNYGFARVNVPS